MDVRRLSYSVNIAGSAALLFVVQPIMAKALLPHFGGSAGVWVTSMMFFQIVLLLGYLYSFWITRYPGPRLRTIVHLCLLGLSLWALPLQPRVDWSIGHPTVAIVLVLASSVGLPFFLLSTTSSLVQSWYAGSPGARLPYRLFAVSNAACILALLAYPVIIEPALPLGLQLRWWSAGYLVVVLLIALGAVGNRAWASADKHGARELWGIGSKAASNRPFLWIALAACASTLWLAIANYLSQEVAPIPFLWVLPLSLYLLSFVISFEREGWYRPALFRWLVPAACAGIGLRTGLFGAVGDLYIDLPILLASLLILCLFCHGELARRKPVARQDLAFFYLMAATGGALGGIFVGLIAPAVFSTYLELPIGVVAAVFLSLVLIYGVTSRARLARLAALAIAAFVSVSSFHFGSRDVMIRRNFYGAMAIRDEGQGDQAVRALYNGRTIHGLEFLSPARRQIPTAYYGPRSGIGLALNAFSFPNRRVAVVGLGAGTLAAYGRTGDFFRFYEINPAVIQAASSQFHFLADSAAATDVVAGDGRLRLEQEAPHSFDLIVLDAFSDDAVPVHLLTRDALQLYFARLRAGGLVAIHTTNRYLNLDPVLDSLARTLGKPIVRIHSAANPEDRTNDADWTVISDSTDIVAKLQPFADRNPYRYGPLWTDEYSNLFQILR